MDLTQKTQKQKNESAKKMMLWFGIVSLVMGFAGWTSAYIVSSSRDDWLKNFELPSSFFISTSIILLSSITYYLAIVITRKIKFKDAKGKDDDKDKEIKRKELMPVTLFLLVTLGLGIAFIVLQFNGFSELIGEGYYFTGPTSSITMSYIFLIAVVHIVHVVAGLISLLVVLFNQIKGKYTAEEMLGLELGATFWHFLGILWVYLMLFFYFYR